MIRPSRRDILKLAAAAPAFALPAPLQALGLPGAGQPAHFRFTLGEMKVTILSDGSITLPTSTIGVNTDPAEVVAFLETHRQSTEMVYGHTNHVLVETGDATVLVDVGSGSRFLNSTGRLMANLEAAGIDPGSITHVVITHAHPDHIWGIRDDFDEPIFPDAAYFVAANLRETPSRQTLLSLATAVQTAWIAEMFPQHLSTTVEHLFDAQNKRVAAMKLVRYRDLVIKAYPPESDGKTLFPFRRLFILANA